MSCKYFSLSGMPLMGRHTLAECHVQHTDVIYLVALLLIPLKLPFVGGNGRRRLTAVAWESEGYTGPVLRSATAGGKFMLYIAPLRKETDMTPQPVDAPEFRAMPKAACTQCKMAMPLHMLGLHVQGSCEGTSQMTLCDSEVKLICHILWCGFSLCHELTHHFSISLLTCENAPFMQNTGEYCHQASRQTFSKTVHEHTWKTVSTILKWMQTVPKSKCFLS